MSILKINEFQLIGEIKPRYVKYFDNNGNFYELSLEPCLNGFDVAIYVRQDEGGWELAEPKRCTDFDFGDRGMQYGFEGLKRGQANMVLLRMLKFADEFYKKFTN